MGLRNALRSPKSRCVPCSKYSASFQAPLMADVPRERVEKVEFPFTYVGVDYFGPLEVKYMRKTIKRLACVFTCLSKRTIHLEMVNSLDTDSCLSALMRFIARRGRTSTIWSDNETNFVGANNELNQFTSMWPTSDFQGKLCQKTLVWKFNPAAAPHFGGSWERMVKTCKQAIYHVLNGQRLTDELLATILCLTEQLVNARPLTLNSNDPTDWEALTPNHFFLGWPRIAIAYLLDSQKYQNHRKMFRVAQAHMDNIWSRWLKEYLPVNSIRQKWYKKRTQLREHDLVWIVDDREKRGFYRLGRVKKCHFGNDGNIRSCDVLTQSGVVSRPTVKFSLCLKTLGEFLLKRNTGPAMKRPENQYTKRSSNWVILESHNSNPNERMNPNKRGSRLIRAKLP